MHFLGNIEAKIDSKGRAFLPAAFRKVLDNGHCAQLVLRKDIHQDCLVLYPDVVWNMQMDVLRASLNRWNKEHQQIFRQFVADAELIELDGNGRFLIPKRYLKMAHIEQSLKFVGVDDTIEIWSNDAGSQPFMEADEFSKAMESIMGKA
ncbi:MAG: division/cell wall cluster transcriptional repressor MraZ [Prevotella sp.]|nr:division/cell wall cluster transcriptional repressor MraZ [Prevotella sp.]